MTSRWRRAEVPYVGGARNRSRAGVAIDPRSGALTRSAKRRCPPAWRTSRSTPSGAGSLAPRTAATWSLSAPSRGRPAHAGHQVSPTNRRARVRGSRAGRFVLRHIVGGRLLRQFRFRRARAHGAEPSRGRAGACRRRAAPPRLPPARAVRLSAQGLTQRSSVRARPRPRTLTPLQTVPSCRRLRRRPWARRLHLTPTAASLQQRARSSTLPRSPSTRPEATPDRPHAGAGAARGFRSHDRAASYRRRAARRRPRRAGTPHQAPPGPARWELGHENEVGRNPKWVEPSFRRSIRLPRLVRSRLPAFLISAMRLRTRAGVLTTGSPRRLRRSSPPSPSPPRAAGGELVGRGLRSEAGASRPYTASSRAGVTLRGGPSAIGNRRDCEEWGRGILQDSLPALDECRFRRSHRLTPHRGAGESRSRQLRGRLPRVRCTCRMKGAGGPRLQIFHVGDRGLSRRCR